MPVTPSRARPWLAEAAATLSLAWPLIVAQLATIALNATDVVMMGWLGPQALAAGSLATSVFYPLIMFGVGIAMAVAPLAALARGARTPRGVRGAVRAGLWVAIGLGSVLTLMLLQAEPMLLTFGQDPVLAAQACIYLSWAAWMVVPHLVFIVLRGLVSVHGQTRIVLRVTLAGIVLNAVLDYVLMFGALGLPRMELRGAGLATSLVHLAMMGMLLAHVLRRRPFRRYAILARLWRPDPSRLAAVVRMGAPIGLMLTAESGLFAVAAVMIGWLGPEPLAGHAVALQLAAIAFMTPLGLSHATAVRVGLAFGAGDAPGTERAGWVSVGLSLAFMGGIALVFVALPGPLTGLFLDRTDPANAAALGHAVRFLGVAALFQIVDGAQVTAAAALRGLGDTRAPMLIALGGYWAAGVPAAYVFGFGLGMGGVGVWLGLAVALALVAVALCRRFARLTGASSPVSQPA